MLNYHSFVYGRSMADSCSGIFQITKWNEETQSQGEHGKKQTVAKITQDYSGDLVGASSLSYVMTYLSESKALFVGFELLTVTINGKSGTFTIKHDGSFENGVASSNFAIIPRSGTDDFINLAGQGHFKSTENGQAQYSFILS